MVVHLRKFIGAAVATFALGSSASISSATVLFSDNFNSYSNGTLGAATNGSNVKWTRTLTSSNNDLLVTSNRVVLNDDNGDDDTAQLSSTVSSGLIYAKMTLVGDAADTASGAAGDYMFSFLSGNNQYGRVFGAKPSGTASTKFRFGVANATTGTTNEVFAAGDLSAGTSYTIVIRFDFSTKQSTLWVNPASEASTSVTATDAIASAGTFDSFIIRQGTSGSAGDYFLDDLVVATTFAEVVPEPASLASIAAVAGMLLSRRRA